MKKVILVLLVFTLFKISSKAQAPATYTNQVWSSGATVLKSPNNRFKLIYQTDGNLVLYKDGNSPIWATNTMGTPSKTLSFQGDGNLVLYNGNNAVWGAQCHGKGGNWIILQDDGNLVIYTRSNQPIWASNTGGR